jgi:hypothetical protein
MMKVLTRQGNRNLNMIITAKGALYDTTKKGIAKGTPITAMTIYLNMNLIHVVLNILGHIIP